MKKQIKIKDLKLSKYNPRKISDEELERLKKSLKEFGFIQDVVINKDNTVISGHQRIKAWEQLGNDTVPTVKINIDKTKEKALNLAMNKISGEWDAEKLYEMINDLKISDDLQFTGFEDKEISKILDNFSEEEVEDEDEVMKDILESKKESKIKLGDIFQLGDHRLMCGDSTKMEDIEKLTKGEKMDMVWTDPPYNVDYESTTLGKIKGDQMKDDEFSIFMQQVFENLSNIVKRGGVFYVCSGWQSFATFQNMINAAGMHLSEVIIWVKNIAGTRTLDFPHKHEQIIKAKNERKPKKTKGTAIMYGWKKGNNHKYYGDRSDYDVWEVDRKASSTYLHPTEKPDWLVMKALANSSKYKDKIIDLFGGSGSALIACEKRGRKAYVMELDPKFVEVIIYRWEKLTKLKAKKI